MEASSYSALVATFLGAVKGTLALLLDLVAVFSSSLFRFVIVVEFVGKQKTYRTRPRPRGRRMTDYVEGWWEPVLTHGGQQGLASLRVLCGARHSQTHSISAPHQLKSACLAWPLLEVYALADAFCAFNKRLENASHVTIGKILQRREAADSICHKFGRFLQVHT